MNEAEFDALIRENVILLLLVLLAWLAAHLLVRAVRGPAEAASLPLMLCVLSLGVSLLMALLPSFTLAADVLITNGVPSRDEYFKWLTTSLLQRMWATLAGLCYACLLVLLPFAYLYHEADDGAKGMLGRFYEAFSVLVLIDALFYGLAYALSLILHGSAFDAYETMTALLTLAGALLSLPALLAGIEATHGVSLTLSVDPDRLATDLERCRRDLDALSIKRDMFLATTSRRTRASPYDDRIAALRVEEARLLADARRAPTSVERGLRRLVVVFNAIISCLLLLQASIANVRELGPGWVGLRVFSIIYMAAATIVGAYRLSMFGYIPRSMSLRAMPLGTLLAHTSVVALFVPSLPIVAALLGIGPLDVFLQYSTPEFMVVASHPLARFAYRVAFVVGGVRFFLSAISPEDRALVDFKILSEPAVEEPTTPSKRRRADGLTPRTPR